MTNTIQFLRNSFRLYSICAILLSTMMFATCKYSFKDVSPLPPEIKTFSVEQFENKARYVNPQLAPQLSEAVRQKIVNQTRLREVTGEMGDYDISGYVSDYSVSTSGVANQQSSTNRLNVSFHLIFKNTQDATKNFETDISTSYDYSADKTLQQGEQEVGDKILKNVSDAIFNKIFSNW